MNDVYDYEGNSSLIELLDANRTVKFTGCLIASTTTEKPDFVRWTELELYRITAGASRDGDVFRVVGRSLVYHKASGGCGKGLVTPAGKLPGFDAQDPGEYDAQPCEICNPPDLENLAVDEVVSMERDWPRVYECADAPDVYVKLVEHQPVAKAGYRRGGPAPRPSLNHPSQRLLEKAATVDPAFAPENVVDVL